jgi:hypothetical protein
MSNFTLTSTTGWKFPNEDADHIHFTAETYEGYRKPGPTIVKERTCGNGVIVEISAQNVFDFDIKFSTLVTKTTMDDLVSAKAAQATVSNLQFKITDWDGAFKTGLIVDVEKSDHIKGPDNRFLVMVSFLQIS